MRIVKSKNFTNGIVHAMETDDGYPVEATDTFLPYYTKDAIGRKQNHLDNKIYDVITNKLYTSCQKLWWELFWMGQNAGDNVRNRIREKLI